MAAGNGERSDNYYSSWLNVQNFAETKMAARYRQRGVVCSSSILRELLSSYSGIWRMHCVTCYNATLFPSVCFSLFLLWLGNF
jgi:hypothetical protein